MTTYIESKLSLDGRTYDHSEVIEAHKKGCLVETDIGWSWEKSKNPNFYSWCKYRAVIEDEPVNDVDLVKRNLEMMIILTQTVVNKFQSGNAIPVERITLTRAEVNEVFPGLLK